VNPKANLMHEDVERRKHLSNLQIAIFRNSRHVTVF